MIDSFDRRMAMMDFDLPWQPGVMPPNWVSGAPERAAGLWLYGWFGAPMGTGQPRTVTLMALGGSAAKCIIRGFGSRQVFVVERDDV